MFTIFEASEEHIPTIIEIAEKTWWKTYAQILTEEQLRYMLKTIYAKDVLQSQIRNSSQVFLILQAEGKPQAFAAYGERPETPEIFKIHKLYVLPDNQNKGYGQALVNEIKRRLQKNGIHVLDLNVNRFNSAKLFYEKLGFKVIREEDVPVGPYWMNDYVMRTEI